MTEQPEQTEQTIPDYTDEFERVAAEAAGRPAGDPEQTSDLEQAASKDGEGGAGPAREAAKYRRRLRESEQRVEELAGRLEAMQRTTVEGLVTSEGRFPTSDAFWAGGTELGALVGADGLVDRDKVLQACEQTAQRLSITRRPPTGYVALEGGSSGTSPGSRSMIDVVMGPE